MFAALTLALLIPQTQSLKIEDPKVGTGEAVKQYDVVDVMYTGTLLNGKEFDSNVKSGKPLHFQVGVGRVIKGWDQGFIGMKAGGERILTIPAALAYGNKAMGENIPANSDLKFTVKLVKVYPSAKISIIVAGSGEPIKLEQFLDCKLSVKPSNGKEMADPTKESRLALSRQMLPWINQALAGIKAGEKRKVVISYELAFGEKGFPAADEKDKKAGSIVPPKSDLNLEIDAIKILD